jgi:hypothetical protein
MMAARAGLVQFHRVAVQAAAVQAVQMAWEAREALPMPARVPIRPELEVEDQVQERHMPVVLVAVVPQV